MEELNKGLIKAADISYSIWDFLWWPLKSMLASVDSIVDLDGGGELKELCLEIESMRFGPLGILLLLGSWCPPYWC